MKLKDFKYEGFSRGFLVLTVVLTAFFSYIATQYSEADQYIGRMSYFMGLAFGLGTLPMIIYFLNNSKILKINLTIENKSVNVKLAIYGFLLLFWVVLSSLTYLVALFASVYSMGIALEISVFLTTLLLTFLCSRLLNIKINYFYLSVIGAVLSVPIHFDVLVNEIMLVVTFFWNIIMAYLIFITLEKSLNIPLKKSTHENSDGIPLPESNQSESLSTDLSSPKINVSGFKTVAIVGVVIWFLYTAFVMFDVFTIDKTNTMPVEQLLPDVTTGNINTDDAFKQMLLDHSISEEGQPDEQGLVTDEVVHMSQESLINVEGNQPSPPFGEDILISMLQAMPFASPYDFNSNLVTNPEVTIINGDDTRKFAEYNVDLLTVKFKADGENFLFQNIASDIGLLFYNFRDSVVLSNDREKVLHDIIEYSEGFACLTEDKKFILVPSSGSDYAFVTCRDTNDGMIGVHTNMVFVPDNEDVDLAVITFYGSYIHSDINDLLSFSSDFFDDFAPTIIESDAVESLPTCQIDLTDLQKEIPFCAIGENTRGL